MLDPPHDAVGLVRRPVRRPARTRGPTPAASTTGSAQRHATPPSTSSVTGPGGGQQFGQSVPATASRTRGRARASTSSRPARWRRRATRRARAAPVGRRGTPAGSAGQQPRWVRSSMPRVISADVPSGKTSHSLTLTWPYGRSLRTRMATDPALPTTSPRVVDRPVVRQRSGVVVALVERLAPRQRPGARVPRRRRRRRRAPSSRSTPSDPYRPQRVAARAAATCRGRASAPGCVAESGSGTAGRRT